jgi:hypothetical protein
MSKIKNAVNSIDRINVSERLMRKTATLTLLLCALCLA